MIGPFGPVSTLIVLATVAFVAFLAAGVLRAGRRVNPELWAADHGISLTEESRKMVEGYLARSRRFRLGGALLGLLLPLGTNIPGIEMIGGYLLGALAAEFTQKRLASEGGRAASLRPRVLSHYLPARIPVLLRSLAVGASLPLALFIWGPEKSPQPVEVRTSLVIAGGIAAMLTPIVVETLLRRMASRSQPASSPELVKADDAIRAASIHAAAGAGTAVTLLLLAGLMWITGVTSDIQPIRWIFPSLGVVGGFAAVGVWSSMGPTTPWKVARNVPDQGAVT